jgi:hypothetical protein
MSTYVAYGKCDECDRTFDLSDENDNQEFWFGHDCEPE